MDTREMFDSIAGEYDKLNHLLSLGIDKTWRKRALKHIVEPQKQQKILDIACGTGDFALEISKKANPGTSITGLDLSEGMLAIMRNKIAASSKTGQIKAVQGNSESMDFPDNSFDCVSIGFGIRNFTHRDTALKEILRVVKPGGRLVILELSVPENRIIVAGYKLYFLHILPVIGGLISGDKAAYRYLPSSVLKFPGKEEWMQTMRDCGWSNVRHKAFTLGICRMYIGEKMK